MERTSEKCNVTADWLAAGKTADGLVDNCLKNRGGEVFFCGSFVDERLDVSFCKNTTTCCDRIQCLIVSGICIQTGSICLKKRCHLVNKRTCTAGTDTIHTLFHISAFKIYDFGVFTAKLNGYICLRSKLLKRGRYCNDFLNKRDFHMVGKCKSTGACDDRRYGNLTELLFGFDEQVGQGFLDVCKVPFVIGEEQSMILIQYCDFYCCGTNVYS